MPIPNILTLAEQIESGSRPSPEIDITQFFTELPNGEFVPDMSKRIQVRRSISANKTSRKKVNELIAVYQ